MTGDAFKALRLKLKFTQQQLAAQLGITYFTVLASEKRDEVSIVMERALLSLDYERQIARFETALKERDAELKLFKRAEAKGTRELVNELLGKTRRIEELEETLALMRRELARKTGEQSESRRHRKR